MQISPDEGQLLQMLLKLLGARRAIEACPRELERVPSKPESEGSRLSNKPKSKKERERERKKESTVSLADLGCSQVGVFTGYSALVSALALPADGQLVACDVSEEFVSVGRHAQLCMRGCSCDSPCCGGPEIPAIAVGVSHRCTHVCIN